MQSRKCTTLISLWTGSRGMGRSKGEGEWGGGEGKRRGRACSNSIQDRFPPPWNHVSQSVWRTGCDRLSKHALFSAKTLVIVMSNETPIKLKSKVRFSKHCRFCNKNLTCAGTKLPRVSLFNVLKNKELLAFCEAERIVLEEVLKELGYDLD